MTSGRPLCGITVIDLTRVLAGPYCTMILKDLGAEVIKIEAPGVGDDARHFGPFLYDDKNKSAYFISINCGKKSITLNLKSEAGKEVLADLIRKADVLVENYRPGTLERLGFSAEKIAEINPELIYASASGFGHSGRDSKEAAYDMIIQARSGLMSITGTEDGENVRVGSSISDIVTGMYTAMGVLATLYRRTTGQGGARVDVAMLDSTVSILENAIARFQTAGAPPKPLGARHPSITPFEQFATKDGHIIIAAGNDKLFAALADTIQRPELVNDERYLTNGLRTEHHAELKQEIEKELVSDSTEIWLEKLAANRVPCARLSDMTDVFEDGQVTDRNMLVAVEGEDGFKVAGSPIKIAGIPETGSKPPAPALGQHQNEVLCDLLGYTEEKVQQFLNDGVL